MGSVCACRQGLENTEGDFPPYFKCGSWTIPYLYQNDFFCDCENCEDEYEPAVTCADCGGCPKTCGGFTNCVEGALSKTFTNEECLESLTIIYWLGDSETLIGLLDQFASYTCLNGWTIPAEYENDDYCDCFDCEDEHGKWSCNPDDYETFCGGCPFSCGDSIPCSKAFGHEIPDFCGDSIDSIPCEEFGHEAGFLQVPAALPNNNTCFQASGFSTHSLG
eukprot:s4972_g3.t1